MKKNEELIIADYFNKKYILKYFSNVMVYAREYLFLF